jgi:hypothetical protein
VVVVAIAALESGMKTWFALGRAVRSSAGVEVGWVISSTKGTVSVVDASGSVVTKS